MMDSLEVNSCNHVTHSIGWGMRKNKEIVDMLIDVYKQDDFKDFSKKYNKKKKTIEKSVKNIYSLVKKHKDNSLAKTFVKILNNDKLEKIVKHEFISQYGGSIIDYVSDFFLKTKDEETTKQFIDIIDDSMSRRSVPCEIGKAVVNKIKDSGVEKGLKLMNYYKSGEFNELIKGMDDGEGGKIVDICEKVFDNRKILKACEGLVKDLKSALKNIKRISATSTYEFTQTWGTALLGNIADLYTMTKDEKLTLDVVDLVKEIDIPYVSTRMVVARGFGGIAKLKEKVNVLGDRFESLRQICYKDYFKLVRKFKSDNITLGTLGYSVSDATEHGMYHTMVLINKFSGYKFEEIVNCVHKQDFGDGEEKDIQREISAHKEMSTMAIGHFSNHTKDAKMTDDLINILYNQVENPIYVGNMVSVFYKLVDKKNDVEILGNFIDLLKDYESEKEMQMKILNMVYAASVGVRRLRSGGYLEEKNNIDQTQAAINICNGSKFIDLINKFELSKRDAIMGQIGEVFQYGGVEQQAKELMKLYDSDEFFDHANELDKKGLEELANGLYCLNRNIEDKDLVKEITDFAYDCEEKRCAKLLHNIGRSTYYENHDCLLFLETFKLLPNIEGHVYESFFEYLKDFNFNWCVKKNEKVNSLLRQEKEFFDKQGSDVIFPMVSIMMKLGKEEDMKQKYYDKIKALDSYDRLNLARAYNIVKNYCDKDKYRRDEKSFETFFNSLKTALKEKPEIIGKWSKRIIDGYSDKIKDGVLQEVCEHVAG